MRIEIGHGELRPCMTPIAMYIVHAWRAHANVQLYAHTVQHMHPYTVPYCTSYINHSTYSPCSTIYIHTHIRLGVGPPLWILYATTIPCAEEHCS